MAKIIERPIIFSTEMVRAILDGRKTQTRRAIKPQPKDANQRYDLPEWELWGGGYPEHGKRVRCPYGQPGDRLWVRETWAVAPLAIHYRAGNDFKSFPDEPRLYDYASTQGWRPSIFMPRWASRITLEVIDVRVERVQDISDADALAEGIYRYSDHAAWTYTWNHDMPPHYYGKAVFAFRALWDSINSRRGYGWDINPWVWVVEWAKWRK